MSTSSNLKLVIFSVAIIRHLNQSLTTEVALEKLDAMIDEVKIKHIELDDAYSFLQPLIHANISKIIFTLAKNSIAYIDDHVITCDQLRNLKFSPKEMLDIFVNNSADKLFRIKKVGARMELFTTHLSILMTNNRNTVPEGINAMLALPRETNKFLSEITAEDVKFLLSPRTQIELYLHAKVGMIMGVNSYNANNSDHQLLEENAKFHAGHQDRIFLEVDIGLTDLDFSLEQVNNMLIANNESIDTLHYNIQLMRNATNKIENELNDLTFEQAKVTVLNNTIGLTETVFEKLLSSDKKSLLSRISVKTGAKTSEPQKKIERSKYEVKENKFTNRFIPPITQADTDRILAENNSDRLINLESHVAPLRPPEFNNPNMLVHLSAGGFLLLAVIVMKLKPRIITQPLVWVVNAFGLFKPKRHVKIRKEKTIVQHFQL
jgi:hypothetical protein